MLNNMNEKEQLKKEIDELEAQIKPRRARLDDIYQEENDNVSEKIERVRRMQDKFRLEELRFSATVRCDCGAGLAYPKDIGIHGSWDCSDILLGRAIPKGQEGSKMHASPLPFAFYEIKSEDQPSANGATTRPSIE